MKKVENRGYQFEKDFTAATGFKRSYSNLSHNVAGDVVDNNGTHYQLKTKDGQMSIPGAIKPANSLETLLSRVDSEKATVFVVGIEKAGKWESFSFTKDAFKQLLSTVDCWKVEKMSSNQGYHFRFKFTTGKKCLFPMVKLAHNRERIEKSK